VNAVVREYGWTKAALDRMVKIDGFIPESQRLNPVGVSKLKLCVGLIEGTPFMLISYLPRTVSTLRVVLKDFTFSDGVRIPAGTLICLPLYATHHDERKYPDPFTFDPTRFVSSDRHADEKGDRHRHEQLVTPGTDFLTWGL